MRIRRDVILVKRKVSLKNIFETDHYRDILFLLIEFDKDGLSLEELRYILVKNDKPYSSFKIKEFFDKPINKDRLDLLIDNNFVERDSITSSNNLGHFLREMGSDGLKIIRMDKRYSKPRYRINKAFYGIGIRIQNKGALDFFSEDAIIDLDEIINSSNSSKPRSRRILYGITLETFQHFDPGDQQTIKECFTSIEKKFEEIENVIFEKDTYNRIVQLRKKTKSKKIKHLLENRPNALLGAISDFIMANYELRFGMSKKDWKVNIEEWGKWLAEDPLPWTKDYHFKKNEIKELIEWAWVNRDYFYNLIARTNIGFSRYRAYSPSLTQLIQEKSTKKNSLKD